MEEDRLQAEELDVAGLSLSEATPEQHSKSLDHLPDDALLHIALCMSDPAALASACRRTAALLSQDAFLADWAAQHQPARLPAGYGLLHWRRVRNSNPHQVAAMLLRQLQKQHNHSTTAQQLSAERLATAQQSLDAGDALSALQALLPHSQQLLVLYAAQLNHMRLLQHLLAAPNRPRHLRVQWGSASTAAAAAAAAAKPPADFSTSLLETAAHAAAGADSVQALMLLLTSMPLDSRTYQYFFFSLLGTAVGGGSMVCVAALLSLLLHNASPEMQERVMDACCDLLREAAEQGSEFVCVQLLQHAPQAPPYTLQVSSNIHTRRFNCFSAFGSAVKYGHLHLLPLLSRSVSPHTACSGLLGAVYLNKDPAVLARLTPLLPHAMWQVRDAGSGTHCWDLGAAGAYLAGDTAVLDTMWASFAGAEEQQELARIMVLALVDTVPLPSKHIMDWVLQHAMPVFCSVADADTIDTFMSSTFRSGCSEFVQPVLAAGLLDLRGDGAKYDKMHTLRDVVAAVRLGDVHALALALDAVQPLLELKPAWRELLVPALDHLAAVPDDVAVEGLVTLLAPQLRWSDRMWCEELRRLWARRPQLLPLLCGLAPSATARLAGDASEATFCYEALKLGQADYGAWLVCHPDQRPDYLSQVLEKLLDESLKRNSEKLASSCAELLWRLTAGGTHVQADDYADAGYGGRGGSSSSSSWGGRQEQAQPPAGARQLSVHGVRLLAEAGNADLLHALLAFIEACNPA